MFAYHIDDEISLRPLERWHARDIFALVDANRAYLRQWLTWVDSNVSVDDTLRFIEASQQQWAENNGYSLSIWYRGSCAGCIGHLPIDWTNRAVEIGYWLSEPLQGRGIMTRACRAFVDFSFSELVVNRVAIRCASENRHSCAIPERLGFQQEGTLREGMWLHEHYVDMVIYSMLAREWRARHREHD